MSRQLKFWIFIVLTIASVTFIYITGRMLFGWDSLFDNNNQTGNNEDSELIMIGDDSYNREEFEQLKNEAISLTYDGKPIVTEDGQEVCISFWGDSMFYGTGSGLGFIHEGNSIFNISYCNSPHVVEYLSNIKTYNFGVPGELSSEISIRAGGIGLYVDRNLTLTIDTPVRAFLFDDYGDAYISDDYSGYGREENDCPNTCYINGYLCKVVKVGVLDVGLVEISLYDNEANREIGSLYVEKGTTVIPKAAEDRKNDILVIEMGSNGGWYENYDELIWQYKQIIEKNGYTRYIIVGDTDDPGTEYMYVDQEKYYGGETPTQRPKRTKPAADFTTNPSAGMDIGIGTNDSSTEAVTEKKIKIKTDISQWEAALYEAFGDHFLNMRVYMLENGLSDCGLTPNNKDIRYLKKGLMPARLRSDSTHFTAYGYYSQGVGIYKKGQELGYW